MSSLWQSFEGVAYLKFSRYRTFCQHGPWSTRILKPSSRVHKAYDDHVLTGLDGDGVSAPQALSPLSCVPPFALIASCNSWGLWNLPYHWLFLFYLSLGALRGSKWLEIWCLPKSELRRLGIVENELSSTCMLWKSSVYLEFLYHPRYLYRLAWVDGDKISFDHLDRYQGVSCQQARAYCPYDQIHLNCERGRFGSSYSCWSSRSSCKAKSYEYGLVIRCACDLEVRYPPSLS